jgi:hypothetical protein
VDFQSAGEMITGRASYLLKHTLLDNRPILYRIRAEQLNGKYFNSAPVLLQGDGVEPVQIYPTIVNGNTVNINAFWPVERVHIYTMSGSQVLVKDIGGLSGRMTVGLPAMGKGTYLMTFYGNNWKSTTQFILP